MHVGRLTFSLIVFSLSLACHAEDVPEAYKALNGNWRLTPAVEDASFSESKSAEYGQMTFTFGVDGSRIYGEGIIEMKCPNDRMGFDAFVDGQISPDGTFILTNLQLVTELPAGSIVIKGSLPAKGTTQWRGEFSSDIKGRNGSCIPETDEIVASQLPALKGTFSGTVQAQDGLKSEVTIEIEQGELLPTDVHMPGFSHCVPLSVTMTVKNASGPLWGTFSKIGDENRKRCNRIAGQQLNLEFATSDGANLHVNGFLMMRDKPIVNSIHLDIHYFPQDFSKAGIQPVHAIGELRPQQTMRPVSTSIP
jgi:hypothetical protein